MLIVSVFSLGMILAQEDDEEDEDEDERGYIGYRADQWAERSILGSVVGEIEEDSPAEKAGLEEGDIVKKIKLKNEDGKWIRRRVRSTGHLIQILERYCPRPGEKIILYVKREDEDEDEDENGKKKKYIEIEVTLGSREEVYGEEEEDEEEEDEEDDW
jgi:C-terminal processing protease CtpA/Prc